MNYSEIVAAALSYADRANDSEASGRIDTFLRIVESRINRTIKVQKMAIRTQLVARDDKEYYGLPLDFAGLRDIAVMNNDSARSSRVTPAFVTPELFDAYRNVAVGIYYTIEANQLRITPQASTKVIEIIYYRRVPELNNTNMLTNWVSDYVPDLYIFGLMVEINAFIKDAEAKEFWDIRFKETLSELLLDDSLSRWSGPSLEIRNA